MEKRVRNITTCVRVRGRMITYTLKAKINFYKKLFAKNIIFSTAHNIYMSKNTLKPTWPPTNEKKKNLNFLTYLFRDLDICQRSGWYHPCRDQQMHR